MDKKSIAYQYWNKGAKEDQNLIGAYPIGRGGEFEIYYRHFFEVKRLKERVHFTSDQVVLELGCGNGRWAYELAPLVKLYVAVDFNGNAIKYCREMAQKMNLTNVEFHENSIEDFSWNHAEKITVLYFSGVSQYLNDSNLTVLLSKYQNLLSDDCIVIDKSSINLEKRLIRDEDNYFSIYRTSDEIIGLFEGIDLEIIDTFRSYIFLRNTFLTNNAIVKKIALGLIPFSYYFFLVFSKFANAVTDRKLDQYIEPYDGKSFDLLFFIFKKVVPNNYGR